jgi:hypothetical protein
MTQQREWAGRALQEQRRCVKHSKHSSIRRCNQRLLMTLITRHKVLRQKGWLHTGVLA